MHRLIMFIKTNCMRIHWRLTSIAVCVLGHSSIACPRMSCRDVQRLLSARCCRPPLVPRWPIGTAHPPDCTHPEERRVHRRSACDYYTESWRCLRSDIPQNSSTPLQRSGDSNKTVGDSNTTVGDSNTTVIRIQYVSGCVR